MTKNRKRVVMGLFLILCLGIFSSSAFLIRKIKTDNVITFGNVKVQLINHTLDENGKEVEVKDGKEELLKYEDVSRIIKVKNVCNHPVYVRVKLNTTGKRNQEIFPAEDYVNYKFADEKWQEKDGWLYYTDVLEPNKTTEDLMRGIEFDVNRLTSEYAGSDIEFKAEVQAVQSENNSKNVFAVEGWPEEVAK